VNAHAFLARLGQRSRPHYGQLTLCALLLCALALAGYFVTHHGGGHPRGERAGPATVLSWLPDAVLLEAGTSWACGGLFVVGAGLWLAGRGLPVSSWLAALAFTALAALHLESSSQATHVAHLTNALLLLYALWYHVEGAAIRAACRAGRFWATPLYPRWAYALSVLAVGLFYGPSGLSKLFQSGPGWANGTSLQLWATLWGDPDSPATRLILADRRVAAALQAVTLLAETGALLAVVWPRARVLVGLALLAFHAGQIAVFGWGFHANMVILALVLLPAPAWVGRAVERLERGRGRRQALTAAITGRARPGAPRGRAPLVRRPAPGAGPTRRPPATAG
jgi:hypothetical protein